MDGPAQIAALLLTYPRSRPALPAEQQASYIEHYRWNRAGAQGLARIVAGLESWMHRRVADGVAGGDFLEIGAGNLNHVPYLPGAGAYDAVEPFEELWRDSPYRACVRRIYSDLREIPQSARYDQIFSVAVLEHLTDLPFVLARSALLLGDQGTFRAGFPSEGGLLWGLAWRSTTGVAYRLRRGLDYANIMRHEHVNSAREILQLLRYFFQRVDVERFPLPFEHLSFYTAATARAPHLERCRSFDALRTESGVVHHE